MPQIWLQSLTQIFADYTDLCAEKIKQINSPAANYLISQIYVPEKFTFKDKNLCYLRNLWQPF